MASVPKIALGVGFGVFVVIMAALLAPTVITPKVPTYTPTPEGVASDTLTVDAGDEHRWRFVDFDRRMVVNPPDTSGWDLMLRRYYVVPRGEIANVGAAAFDSVTTPPDSGYVRSRFARDTGNAATDHWYSYSYFSHLLSPKPQVFVLRGPDGRFTKLEILSYYCPGTTAPTPGCTTMRFTSLGDHGRN